MKISKRLTLYFGNLLNLHRFSNLKNIVGEASDLQIIDHKSIHLAFISLIPILTFYT